MDHVGDENAEFEVRPAQSLDRPPEIVVLPDRSTPERADDSGPQDRLDRLVLLAAGLAQAVDLQDVIRIALAQGLGAVGAQGATLAILEDSELRVAVATGFPWAVVEKFLRLPLDADLPLCQAARHRQPVWISSAQERTRRFPLLKGVESGVSASASLPLVAGGLLLGALGIAFPDDRRLDGAERSFLLALADLISLAIRRFLPQPSPEDPGDPPPSVDLGRAERLAEIHRLDLLRQAPRPTLERICNSATRVLGARRAEISVLATEPVVIAGAGLAPGPPLPSALCLQLVALGRPLNIARASSHPWVRDLPVVTSGSLARFLGVPLSTSGGEVFGMLSIFDDLPGQWPDVAESLLEEFAASVVTELELEVGTNELRRAISRAEQLHTLARALGNAVTSLQMAEVVHRQLPMLMDAGTVALAGLSPDGRLVRRFFPRPSLFRAPQIPVEQLSSMDEMTMRTLFPDLPSSASLCRLNGPIGPVGLLAVVDGRSAPADRVTLNDDVRQMISQTLERVRSQEAAARIQVHTAFLAQASLVLDASLDTQETLQRLTRLLVPAIADTCVVRLATTGGALAPVAIAHTDAGRERNLNLALERLPARATGLTWSEEVMAAERGQVRESADLTDEAGGESGTSMDGDLWLAVEFSSAICVPMIGVEGGSPLGTLMVGRTARRTGYDDVDDLAMLEDLGRRAGRALHNTLLHRELLATAQQLREARVPLDLSARAGLDLAARYVPAEPLLDIGGDFYDVWSVVETRPQEGLQPGAAEVWLAVGDVYGGRGEAAAMSGLIRHTLRAVVGLLAGPGPVLERLNGSLMGADLRTRLCSVALVRHRHNGADHQVTLSSAGQAPALLIRNSGEVEILTVAGQLLGLRPRATFSERAVELRQGDLLVLYTDGVVQAQGVEWMYGQDRLIDQARACVGMSAQEVVDRLSESVREYRTTVTDDFAFLALRVTPQSPEGRMRIQ